MNVKRKSENNTNINKIDTSKDNPKGLTPFSREDKTGKLDLLKQELLSNPYENRRKLRDVCTEELNLNFEENSLRSKLQSFQKMRDFASEGMNTHAKGEGLENYDKEKEERLKFYNEQILELEEKLKKTALKKKEILSQKTEIEAEMQKEKERIEKLKKEAEAKRLEEIKRLEEVKRIEAQKLEELEAQKQLEKQKLLEQQKNPLEQQSKENSNIAITQREMEINKLIEINTALKSAGKVEVKTLGQGDAKTNGVELTNRKTTNQFTTDQVIDAEIIDVEAVEVKTEASQYSKYGSYYTSSVRSRNPISNAVEYVKYNLAKTAMVIVVGGCIVISLINVIKPSAINSFFSRSMKDEVKIEAVKGISPKSFIDTYTQNFEGIFKVLKLTQLGRSRDSLVRNGLHKYATPENRPNVLDILELPENKMNIEELKKISIFEVNPQNIKDWEEFGRKCNDETRLGGPRQKDEMHKYFYYQNGIDICASSGTRVCAPVGGQVVFAGKSCGSYGGLVIIRTFMRGEEHFIFLGHLQSDVAVSIGDIVKPRDFIGKVNYHPEGSHLHIEIDSKLSAIKESKGWYKPDVEIGINKDGVPIKQLPEAPYLGDIFEKGDWRVKYRNCGGFWNRYKTEVEKIKYGFMVENIFFYAEDGSIVLPINQKEIADVSGFKNRWGEKIRLIMGIASMKTASARLTNGSANGSAHGTVE